MKDVHYINPFMVKGKCLPADIRIWLDIEQTGAQYRTYHSVREDFDDSSNDMSLGHE